jgi:competence protein ComEC
LRGGDSLFADAPGSALDLLVDTGDTNAVGRIAAPYLRSRGINRLPNLALTHGDVRHVGGAADILREFRPRQTTISRVRSRSSAYRQVIKLLEIAGAGWQQVDVGDQVCGWRVLHPPGDAQLARADDNALVLSGEYDGVRVLLCSDLGRLGQKALAEREPDLRADLVIAGMPNADEPLSDGFLEFIRPSLIVISSGEYPASERPSRALRMRLERAPAPVLFTGDSGAVYLTIRKGRWHARTHDGGEWTGEASGDAGRRSSATGRTGGSGV